MKKTIKKIIVAFILLLLLSAVAFAVLVYCYSDYLQYSQIEELSKFHFRKLMESNEAFIYIMAFIYPACLYAFLGNRYLRIVKKVPNKTLEEKFKMIIYTVLFFIAGEIITGIPINIIFQIIFLMYCRIFNLEIIGFTTATSSLFGVFSSATAIFIYQILLEKHLESAEKDGNAEGNVIL